MVKRKISAYPVSTDEILQAQATSGDREAEENLARRYVRLVRICARPYFLAGGDSEDLTQEGMFGLLSAIRTYDPAAGTAFKTYAELCIKRRILSAVKNAARKKHTPLNEGVPFEQVLSEESQAHIASSESFRRIPEEQVLARESELEFLSAYGRQLTKLEREVLQYYLEGYSCREIALRLSRPVKSVDNAVQRVRRKLASAQKSGEISIG